VVQPNRLLLKNAVLDLDARAFCTDFIRHNRLTMTSVILTEGALAPSCAQTQLLLSNLVDLPSLVTLDLSGNALTAVETEPLTRLLAAPGLALTALVLDDNEISDRGMSALCGALWNNSTLTHLSVSNNRISGACCETIARLLTDNTTLTHFDMSFNPRASASSGVDLIPSALIRNTSLTALNVACCDVDSTALAFFAAMLRVNTTLRDLVLNDAIIAGDSILARGLQHNASLERLHLHDCDLRDDGVGLLVAALIANPASAVADLGLCSVGMTSVGLIALMRLVNVNSTVRVLHVSGHQITDAGWAAVAATLRTTSTLTQLTLADGPLVSSGASRLALQEAVRVCPAVDLNLEAIDLFQPLPIPTGAERHAARAALLASGAFCGLRPQTLLFFVFF
jgi:Ran GTPase-activating protein (RanGAP) involved in mRNA processing and transport